MKNAFLLRAPGRDSAVVLLRDTHAVVHIELRNPLTAEEFVRAQGVNALSPLPVDVELGPYDLDRARFLDCGMSADLPETAYQRVDYLGWRRKRK